MLCRRSRVAATRMGALVLSLALTACGGGGGAVEGGSCSVADQQSWLSTYMNEWYFWYRLAPRPDATHFGSVNSFFQALLYSGSSPDFPADRWSGSETTASFNRFFGEGQSLGFGVSVAGLEVTGQPGQPLYVRIVDPGSPAAAAGVRRGDQVLTLNGRSASDAISANDFSALTSSEAGQVLDLRLQRGNQVFDSRLQSAVYSLTPVGEHRVFTTAGGRRMGYLHVRNMISQAQSPIELAFANFRSSAVQDLVLDLRYNGGGLVSMGGTLASHITGPAFNGSTYAALLYNDQRAATNNQTYRFSAAANALSLNRVFVLTGQRTCSASEQVINGLRGAGLQVVSIGDTTCGKPVGFLPAGQCGQTYSVVNFESVNARNEGRYWDGFDATCPVAEDWQVVQGADNDPLVAAAQVLADGSACPTAGRLANESGRKQRLAAGRSSVRPGWLDEPGGMLAR